MQGRAARATFFLRYILTPHISTNEQTKCVAEPGAERHAWPRPRLPRVHQCFPLKRQSLSLSSASLMLSL